MPRPDVSARARRLIALLPHLRKNERVLVADLAALVGATPEEVSADLATLTMCGVPPFSPLDMVDLAIDGDSVTAYMDPPALDRPLRLTSAEARAVSAALEIAGFASDAPLRLKLAEVCAGSVSLEELERTVRAGTSPEGIATAYATLASAIEECEKVRLYYYTGATGVLAERTIRPRALVQRLGVWYLTAWCESAGGERVFRLDRIRMVEKTGDRFESEAPAPASVTPDVAGLPVADVLFDPGVAVPDERQWPGSVTETRADGATLVRVPYQSPRWLARQVASYLGSAEVTGPALAREAVRDLVERLLQVAG